MLRPGVRLGVDSSNVDSDVFTIFEVGAYEHYWQ